MPKMTVPPDRRSKALQYYHANREARKAKALQWNKDNPEALQASKERARAKEYGLTVEQLRAMLARETCDICGEPFSSTKHRHVDHDHETGKARGLLCSNCNHAIGKMKDSPELLRKAADYLENSYEYEATATPNPAD